MGKAIVEILAWLGLRALGWEDAAYGILFFGMAVYSASLAFGPMRWITHPDNYGEFAEEFPYFTRTMYFLGTILCLGLTYWIIAE